MQPETEFHAILSELRQPYYLHQSVKHDVTHHIADHYGSSPDHTSEHIPLVYPQNAYIQIASQEFEQMMQQDIICPSSSPWSSPLHMVPKITLAPINVETTVL